jgi:hypothetical protein
VKKHELSPPTFAVGPWWHIASSRAYIICIQCCRITASQERWHSKLPEQHVSGVVQSSRLPQGRGDWPNTKVLAGQRRRLGKDPRILECILSGQELMQTNIAPSPHMQSTGLFRARYIPTYNEEHRKPRRVHAVEEARLFYLP